MAWQSQLQGLVCRRFASQVLRDVPESMLRRMRPDMLLIEKHTGDNVLPTLHDLEYPWIGGAAGFMLLRWDFAQK